MRLVRAWSAVERVVEQIGVGQQQDVDSYALEIAEAFGLVSGPQGEPVLTDMGGAYYFARSVAMDEEQAAEVLAQVLRRQPVVNAFCEALWPIGEVSKAGAISLLKRLMQADDASSATRWLDVMNRGRLITYNRANPKVRVIFNPSELAPPDVDAERELERAHLISPDRPYGNLLVFREMLRAAREWISWYEPHLPPKALELLYREVEAGRVQTIRLLSGAANLTPATKDEFKRFRREMRQQRGVDVTWYVLDKKEAFKRHDRIFLSEGLARNVPPVNTILAGSTGEILPSEITVDDFEDWWQAGTPLEEFPLDP